MTDPTRAHETTVLSESLTKRVLTRASEIDAALRSGATIAQLRAAALEAGISEQAFEAALAEAQSGESEVTGRAPSRPRWRRWAVLVAALVTLIAGYALRRTVPAGPPIATVEEAILLRCLTPTQALEILRPHLGPTTTVTTNKSNAPNILTVKGPPEDIQKVHSVLEPYEGPGATCVR